MPDDNTYQELSLDDIFFRGRKAGEAVGKVTGQPFKFLDSYTREDISVKENLFGFAARQIQNRDN
jgi:hypothetical protein